MVMQFSTICQRIAFLICCAVRWMPTASHFGHFSLYDRADSAAVDGCSQAKAAARPPSGEWLL
jgi:hypothetical protein